MSAATATTSEQKAPRGVKRKASGSEEKDDERKTKKSKTKKSTSTKSKPSSDMEVEVEGKDGKEEKKDGKDQKMEHEDGKKGDKTKKAKKTKPKQGEGKSSSPKRVCPPHLAKLLRRLIGPSGGIAEHLRSAVVAIYRREEWPPDKTNGLTRSGPIPQIKTASAWANILNSLIDRGLLSSKPKYLAAVETDLQKLMGAVDEHNEDTKVQRKQRGAELAVQSKFLRSRADSAFQLLKSAVSQQQEGKTVVLQYHDAPTRAITSNKLLLQATLLKGVPGDWKREALRALTKITVNVDETPMQFVSHEIHGDSRRMQHLTKRTTRTVHDISDPVDPLRTKWFLDWPNTGASDDPAAVVKPDGTNKSKNPSIHPSTVMGFVWATGIGQQYVLDTHATIHLHLPAIVRPVLAGMFVNPLINIVLGYAVTFHEQCSCAFCTNATDAQARAKAYEHQR